MMDAVPFWLVLADIGSHTFLLVDGPSSEILAELPYPPPYAPQGFIPADAGAIYIPAAAGGKPGAVFKLDLSACTLQSLTAALPPRPLVGAWARDTSLLYVATADRGLWALDPSSQRLDPVKTAAGGTFAGLIAVDGLIYAALEYHSGGGALLAMDNTGRTTALWDIAGTPTNLHLAPDGKSLLMPFTATAFTGEGVALFPLGEDGLPTAPAIIHIQCSSTVGLHAYPCYVAFAPNGRTAYVVNEDCATLSVLNLASRAAVGCIPLGRSISELHLCPDGRLAFATSHQFADITIIDLVNNRPLATSTMAREIYGRMCLVYPPPPANR